MKTTLKEIYKVSGMDLKKYFQSHSLNYHAKYKVDENTDYTICMYLDSEKFEVKRRMLHDFIKKARDRRFVNVVDGFMFYMVLYYPINKEKLIKMPTENDILSEVETIKQKNNEEKVLDTLKTHGPMTVENVARKSGVHYADTTGILNKFKNSGKITITKDNSLGYWRILYNISK